MDDSIIKIVSLVEIMRPTMDRAGIGAKFMVFSECDKLPGYCTEEALTWLQSLHDGAFKDAQKIRNLVSEATWKRYEDWEDSSDLRECILYAEKLKVFKAACRNRPLIFRHSAAQIAVTENANKKPKNKAKVKNEN